jgi:hypothetical protein
MVARDAPTPGVRPWGQYRGDKQATWGTTPMLHQIIPPLVRPVYPSITAPAS